MFQTKIVEKIKIHICLQLLFFKNRAVYEIMCIKTKFIFLFPLQQWLHKLTTMLH